ncbi:hypothetical protein OH77DRAFT_970466 [Trametes cingulata]|nr:hypothetical protein OH77DRAFT_970466 [Trametes cingulata]
MPSPRPIASSSCTTLRLAHFDEKRYRRLLCRRSRTIARSSASGLGKAWGARRGLARDAQQSYQPSSFVTRTATCASSAVPQARS